MLYKSKMNAKMQFIELLTAKFIMNVLMICSASYNLTFLLQTVNKCNVFGIAR